MTPQILMSSLVWALTGTLVGTAVATFFLQMNYARWFILVFAGLAIAIGLMPSFRGEVGTAVGAGLGSLVGWTVGAMLPGFRVGVILIIAGAAGGVIVGNILQSKFTRNTRRSAGAGTSDFYENRK